MDALIVAIAHLYQMARQFVGDGIAFLHIIPKIAAVTANRLHIFIQRFQ